MTTQSLDQSLSRHDMCDSDGPPAKQSMMKLLTTSENEEHIDLYGIDDTIGENGNYAVSDEPNVHDVLEDISGSHVYEDIVESSDGTKYFIPNVPDDIKPRLNQQFASISEAEAMYRTYADKAGFDVRLNAKKTNKYGSIQTRWFVCSKEGIPKKKNFDSLDLRPGDRRYRNSNVKRSGCNACVKFHLMKDKSRYELYQFVEAHNHVMYNTNDRRFSKKNRRMQYTDYRNILNCSTYKVGATRTHRIQTALKGGVETNRGTVVDYQNFKRDVGLVVGNKDAKMLINKMTNRKEINNDYFFEYKCNERELHAIFWADEVARLNYQEFGDVISFDATYRTNEHVLVFVPFLAVDNHKCSLVVGSALIGGETIENFTWVLRAFLRCYKKQPLIVITDQCSAMKQAVPFVFTEARHRLCLWHIMKKVPSKVSVALSQDLEFNRVINQLVWNVNISPEDFEEQWHTMIEKYNLVGESWFSDMYEIRHSWIPAYYKDNPMSGLMKTTSRSESANAFFNLYVRWSFDLVQFLKNYDFALEMQRDNHYHNEHVTRTTYPHMVSILNLEAQAAKLYTRTIFNEFQKELKNALYSCIIDVVENLGDAKSYIIRHKNKLNASVVKYKVLHTYVDNTVDCECNFFVRNGFLCRHALNVLINSEVDYIPDKYILRRWTCGLVPVQIQPAKVRYGEVDSEKESLITGVYSRIDAIVSRVRNDKSHMSKLSDILDGFKKELDTQLPYDDPSQQKEDAIQEYFGVPIPSEVDIFPLTGLRNKGCGTGKRLVSVSEKMQMNGKKRKRKCKRCGECTGHDSRNCPSLRTQ